MKPIHTMIAMAVACVIGKPTLAFGEDPEAQAQPSPGVIPESVTAASFVLQDDDAEGDDKPSFDKLDEKYGDDGVETLGKKPKTKVDGDAQGEETDDDATPDPEAAAAAARAEKEKKATDAAAEEKKRQDEAAEAEKQAKEKKPDDKKTEPAAGVDADKELKELESLTAPPGASAKTVAGWDTLKQKTAAAFQEVKRLSGEITALKATGVDPELKTKLETAEKELQDLREFRQMIEIEEDPQFQKEFSAKLETADTSLLKFLVADPKLGLSQEVADELKKVGLDSADGRETLNEILTAVHKTGNHLLYERVKAEVLKRDQVVEEKVARSTKLREQRDVFFTEHNQQQEKQVNEFKTRGDAHLNKIATGEWCNFKEVPKDATPEVKRSIEEHNARIEKEVQPKFFEAIQKAYARDPETLVEAVYAKFERDHLKQEVEAKDKEIAEAKKRIEELTKSAAGVRKIAKVGPGSKDTGDIKPVTADVDPEDGGAALDAFLSKKKIK